MADRRPKLPRPLERELLVEAGHRCAIPTCRQVPLELCHIIPWNEVSEHTFDNIIVLCRNCHFRFDHGEIDRKAMRMYKANLATLTGRYGDLERRVLQRFADEPDLEKIELLGGFDIMLMYLIRDGLLRPADIKHGVLFVTPAAVQQSYCITEQGREFVRRWMGGEPLDGDHFTA